MQANVRRRFPRSGYTRAYKEGWNSASAGTLPHQNPYPNVTFGEQEGLDFWAMAGAFAQDFPQANYQLWLSGYADYMASPYNCEANRRYGMFCMDSTDAIIMLGAMQNGDWFTYADGSSILMGKESISVYGRDGVQFIELPIEHAESN